MLSEALGGRLRFRKLPGGEEVLAVGTAGVSGITTKNTYHEMSLGKRSVWETEGALKAAEKSNVFKHMELKFLQMTKYSLVLWSPQPC